MKKIKNWTTRDINEAAYLKFRGIPINLQPVNNLIIFEAPPSDELYRLITAYNMDDAVPVLTYSAAIRALKAKMFALKGGTRG